MPTVIGHHNVQDTQQWLASPKREEFFGLTLTEIWVSTVSNSLMPWVKLNVPVTLVASSCVAPPPICSLA